MDPGAMLQGRTRETSILRDAQGRWFHEGQPLEHPNLTRAFDRWIERAEDGRYCLKNDINWAYFTLQGPPFFVRSLRVVDDGSVELLLSNDKRESLRPESLRLGDDLALYCDVGDGSMVARFDRHAAAQLEVLISEDEQGVYLDLGGKRVRPQAVADPLVPRGPGAGSP
ncbi:MAG: hypothetical protein ACHQ53_01765 [Polyangiales bacterium]